MDAVNILNQDMLVATVREILNVLMNQLTDFLYDDVSSTVWSQKGEMWKEVTIA